MIFESDTITSFAQQEFATTSTESLIEYFEFSPIDEILPIPVDPATPIFE
jgi:hypothetical protein